MFGYVKPDNPNMYVKDVVLYKASYCGLCKSIGKSCGQKARMCLSFDLAFLSCFLHNLMNVDMEVVKERCVLHHIKPRPVSKPTELSKRIANLNVILAYHKINDDVLDTGKGKIKKSLLNSAYKKLQKSEPILCQIVENSYKKTFKYEQAKGDSTVFIAEIFGQMLLEAVKELSGEYFTDEIGNLAFNLGKWIYVIDALDDYDKDVKKGEYNPFIYEYDDVKTKKDLIKNHKQELTFLFGDMLMEIANSNAKIRYYFNHDLIDNILTKGIKAQTVKLMEDK